MLKYHRGASLAITLCRRALSESSNISKKVKGGKYSSSVLLPTTSFDQRANAAKREPEIQKLWNDMNIFEKLRERNANGDVFVLHDGPPYANGKLHIGHALNKILKDIINKYQALNGKKVHYVPGWDCHGLPIELKVLQSLKSSEREALTPIQLRQRAAAFAATAIADQKQAFKRYGIWGDWDNAYMTMSKEYEASQIRLFGDMLRKGYIYRGLKPVHWSPSSRTALAEAELEYPDNHTSRSIYVGFDVSSPSTALNAILLQHSLTPRLVVWTTTPWTLPANQAVAVRADLEYVIVSFPPDGGGDTKAAYIVAKALIETFCNTCALPLAQAQIIGVISGSDLAGSLYMHPLYATRTHAVVVGGDYINTESGTGLVHTAPGHGAEDFAVGQNHHLPLLSPVDDAGRFTEEAGEILSGLEVLGDGNAAVIRMLSDGGYLLMEEPYQHKYPYDWRTKKPTIFRATVQWFASIDAFRQDVQGAIDAVKWVPAIGQNRLSTMVASRRDWCISRQRAWGVPIPVFYHKQTGEVLATEETIRHIEGVFKAYGSNAWWEMDIAALLPPHLGTIADDYYRGTDTMDVWFDSGSSWQAVLCPPSGNSGADNNDCSMMESNLFPADVYLEGSDQHRGWFQSSLLTAVATTPNAQAPFKTVLTHGFVLDEKGHKMSKSIGNVIDPDCIINGGPDKKTDPAYGADTLRLWVAGVDYTNDICIGNNIVKGVSDNYRKLRNTLRYVIGSLHEFDPTMSAVPIEQLPALDRYMLGLLTQTFDEVDAAYSDYQFYKATQLISQFSNKHLSSFYLDISKDRLYISAPNDFRRRSCQTVLSHVLEQLTLMMAPLVPHMAEDVWQNYPWKPPTTSVFQRGWRKDCEQFQAHDVYFWEDLLKLRDDVNHCIEVLRRRKEVGASQECQVLLYMGPVSADHPKAAMMHRIRDMVGGSCGGDAISTPQHECATNGIDDLRYLFIVSQVTLVTSLQELHTTCTHVVTSDISSSGFSIGVARAAGRKCERCWCYSKSVGTSQSSPDTCTRCEYILANQA